MTKGTEPVQAWRAADGRYFEQRIDAVHWDEVMEYEVALGDERGEEWLQYRWRQGVLEFLAWRRERERAANLAWQKTIAESHADRPKRGEKIIEHVRWLRTETDRRIEHGAQTGGHLEYARDKMDEILHTMDPAESHADKPDDSEGGTARPVTAESVVACLRALSDHPVVCERTARLASTQRRFEVIL